MRHSRRNLFRLLIAPGPRPAAPMRPPGAVAEESFLAACTKCGDCITACPHGSVREGPVIVPEEQPCWMCEDLPCIAACATGALAPLESPADARMATLRVSAQRCYSAIGCPCEVCVERCPVEPKPIGVELGATPWVDTEACTGCGVCAWLCPAEALELRVAR